MRWTIVRVENCDSTQKRRGMAVIRVEEVRLTGRKSPKVCRGGTHSYATALRLSVPEILMHRGEHERHNVSGDVTTDRRSHTHNFLSLRSIRSNPLKRTPLSIARFTNRSQTNLKTDWIMQLNDVSSSFNPNINKTETQFFLDENWRCKMKLCKLEKRLSRIR